MTDYKPFYLLAHAGEELILTLGQLPKRITSRDGQKITQLYFTHGTLTAEEMAFHASDVLTQKNWERLRANEPVEQITNSIIGRYKVSAFLYPELTIRFRPISFLP